MERKRIAIIGVGLIGGSLAIQLHEKKLSSRLIGSDANKEHEAKALELELVDEVLPLNEAIAKSEVVILAFRLIKWLDCCLLFLTWWISRLLLIWVQPNRN